MNPSTRSASSQDLPDNYRAALLNLLADEDPAVYRTIREKIISYGPLAADWLRPHALSREPALRRRAQEIVHHFDREAADISFMGFCLRSGEDCDLEEGAWLLARTHQPDINVEAYRALLDSYAADLRERLDLSGEPRSILAAMNHYLFEELRFSGDSENYYDPANSYLCSVVDRRRGNPINLSLVYLLLGRRLLLPLTGIGLPGHFICRYQSSVAELYVDPFHEGKFMSRADCVQYLVQGNYDLRQDYLTPVTPRRLLSRICANLHQIYTQTQCELETTRFQRYLVALAR